MGNESNNTVWWQGRGHYQYRLSSSVVIFTFFDWYKASVVHDAPSLSIPNLAVELLSQKDYLWPIKRHIKFKLDQIDLPKDIKLFHGQSLEAVEDILKAHCDKIGKFLDPYIFQNSRYTIGVHQKSIFEPM